VERDVAEGSAFGAWFMALFGAAWAAAGASALGGATRVATVAAAVALAAALVVGGIRARRAAGGLPRDDSPEVLDHRRRLFRRFNLVNGLQWLAIAVAGVLLGRAGLAALIPAAVAFVVGVHFFPLAALFGVRVYYATGAALCALSAIALFVAPPARLALVGLGSAAVLFATGAYVLSLARAPRRPPIPTR
jgi:hypothetical protein